MPKNEPCHVSINYLKNTKWDVLETNQTLSVRRNSDGELTEQWNKHSLWWKHQFWHQCHIWLTCASLANDWIVNETYPSREGWALDKSGFVITAGAVGEARSAQRKGLYIFLSNLFPQGALHLPSNRLLPPGFNTPSFLLSVISLFQCNVLVTFYTLSTFVSVSWHKHLPSCSHSSCIHDLQWKLCRHVMNLLFNGVKSISKLASESEQGELCHVTALLTETIPPAKHHFDC